MSQAKTHYTANYCEENIWHLAQSLKAHCRVVFISNSDRQIAMWHQKGATSNQPLVWDYHVVLFEHSGPTILCHDFDSRLGRPIRAEDYLLASFPHQESVNPVYHPRFKLIDKADYLAHFASDRSHMQKDGEWLSEPPAWPCIGGGSANTLQQFIDSDDERFGRNYSLEQLLKELSGSLLA